MEINNKIKEENISKSLAGSLVIHVLVILIFYYLLGFQTKPGSINTQYVQFFTGEPEKFEKVEEKQPQKEEEKLVENEKKETPVDDSPGDKEPEKKEETKAEESFSFHNFNINNADTSNLTQIYSEKTLNVKVRYPAGWTYVDQNRKNKLDGVTFWFANPNYNPPPYVHLEVKEKYLFNKNRFTSSMKGRNYIAYYNEPEELEGQFSQTIYIRTESDEDYSLKLIMKGKEPFKTFQPIFFGMVKSFTFGSSIF